jgi:cyclopropane fatty-acyl-phospholipid synthase-like methyltransferase
MRWNPEVVMSRAYELAYRFGITPWEHAGKAGEAQLARMMDREERDHPGLGRALDLGCGRGTHSISLARRGWQVTGVDLVPRAVAAARGRAKQAGQDVTFLVGDVSDLPAEVGAGYQLVMDIGCFHGLSEAQQERMAQGITAVTEPSATVLLLCFAPTRAPGPHGASRSDVMRAFAGWSVDEGEPADTSGLPGPMKRRAPTYYRLRRA